MTDRPGSEELVAKLQRALDLGGNTHEIGDIVRALREGRMQAFEGTKSLMITEVLTSPRRRTLHVFLAAGDLSEIRAMQPRLDAFARETGCSAMSLSGRKGWVRALAPLGWRPHTITMTREVTP